MIYGYSLIGSINHPKHGIGTLVRNDLPATEIDRSRVDSEIQCLTISTDGEITITNFYKPPNSPFDPPPQYEHPAMSVVTIQPGATPKTTMTEKLYMTALIQSTLSCFTIITNQKRFILLHGTPTRNQI